MLFFLIPSIAFEWLVALGPRDLVYYAVLVPVLISLNLAAIVEHLEEKGA